MRLIRNTRRLWAAVGLLAGLVLLGLLVFSRQAPEREDQEARALAVRTIMLQPLAFRFEARGYGVSRAAESWQAVANVPGRVVERHPELESGRLVRAGTQLLALDPSRYELAIAEAEADLASLAAEGDQLETEQENTGRLLALERERLELAEQELTRIERLVANGSLARSREDEQRRATLAQRQAVAKLSNELKLIPVRRDRLAAQRDRARTRLEQSRQDLADTRFVAPFDLRVASVAVERHQYVAAGQPLFQGDGLAAAEVEAHIPLSMLRRLMGGVVRPEPASTAFDLHEQLDFSAIGAEVRLVDAEMTRWPARLERVASGLDPITRAVRVVVTVDEPYADVAPPKRPALQPGMYLQVRLSAPSPQPLLTLPASAVHDGEVYRVADGPRLERRPVEVAFEQDDLAVIAAGLLPGDQVIVDDPLPAIDGMAVVPRRDEALEREMRAQAAGNRQ